MVHKQTELVDALAPFAGCSRDTLASSRASEGDDPSRIDSLLRALTREDYAFVTALIAAGENARDPSSYWQGVNDLLLSDHYQQRLVART